MPQLFLCSLIDYALDFADSPLIGRKCPPVCLVHLVYLVSLVNLVCLFIWLVSVNQIDQTNQITQKPRDLEHELQANEVGTIANGFAER